MMLRTIALVLVAVPLAACSEGEGERTDSGLAARPETEAASELGVADTTADDTPPVASDNGQAPPTKPEKKWFVDVVRGDSLRTTGDPPTMNE